MDGEVGAFLHFNHGTPPQLALAVPYHLLSIMSLRNGKSAVDMEKSNTVMFDDGKVDVQNAEQHLQELEVDVSMVLLEEGEFDFESDQSPFPEGIFSN